MATVVPETPMNFQAEIERMKTNRHLIDVVTTRSFFYAQSASIYSERVSGLYDYGPMGCKLKNNIIQHWRNHFILEEDMLEVECSSITPDIVLRTSGHVSKFQDYMVRDVEKPEKCYRADHLLEETIDKLLENPKLTAEQRTEYETIKAKADSFDKKDLHTYLEKFDARHPETGGKVTEPQDFNLMFITDVGPTGKTKAFLRPETAQGIFTNFQKLLDENRGQLPFAAAQIGTGFRNEIAPRSGLIRVREFQMAEIEHFCSDKKEDEHPKFLSVADTEVALRTRDVQESNGDDRRLTVGQACKDGLIKNETLAYYMARTQQFLVDIGIDLKRLRFRQHLEKELAHYAEDVWDAEILTSYGWVECAGLADRESFDLKAHMEKSKVPLVAHARLDKPRIEVAVRPKLNQGLLGKTFKKAAKGIREKLSDHSKEELEAIIGQLQTGPVAIETCDGKFELTAEMLTGVDTFQKTIHEYTYVPRVVEPSFGIGRILYALLEHSFWSREDKENASKPVEAAAPADAKASKKKDKKKKKKKDAKPVETDVVSRTVFSFSPLVAPISCAIVALITKDAELTKLTTKFRRDLARRRVTTLLDNSSANIGRRYARLDERGVPFCCAFDMKTLEDKTITIRDRDSMEQVRVDLDAALDVLQKLQLCEMTWSDLKVKYPLV